jgi:glycosyltransferase involved in cell wall biosynthesis
MKKVFFVIPNLECGGAERVTVTFAKHLKNHHYSPVILNIGPDKGKLQEFIAGELPIISLGRKSVSSSMVIVIKLLIREKPDFVFSSFNYVSVWLLLINFFIRNLKIIVRVPTMPSNILDHQTKTKIVRSLQAFLFQNAYRIISQTDEMEKEVLEKYGVSSEKIITINNPLDFEYIHSRLEDSANPFQQKNTINFLTVGNISFAKGIDILVKAFGRFDREFKNAHLHIIGRNDTNYAQNLMEMVKSSDDHNIHFLGFRSNPYIYMKYCDALIISSRMEGLPNVLLEANYLDKPIISTRCVPFVEKIISHGRNGLVIETESVEQMYQALKSILKIKSNNKIYKDQTSKALQDFESILV